MKKILLGTLIVIAILGVGLYFWLSPLNSDIDMGLQKLNESPLVLSTNSTTSGWQQFQGSDWNISYPPSFDVKQIPLDSGQRSFVFSGKVDKSISINITEKFLNSLLEKDSIQKIQQVVLRKNASINVPDAIVLVQQTGNNSLPQKERPKILVERRVLLNGIQGAQFATQDPKDNSIFLRTTFEKNGKIIDITIFTKSLDESDPSIMIYTQMLSSFSYANN